MNKLILAAALVGGALAVQTAQANVILDDFSLPIPGQVIFDNTGGGVSLVTGNPSVAAGSRTVAHTLLTAGAIGSNSGNLSSAGTGAAPNFVAGRLNMANANDTDSVVSASWSTNTIVLAGAGSLLLDIMSNDVGVGSANVIEAFFNGTSLGTLVASVGTVSWGLTAAQIAALGAGPADTILLTFNGSNAWDMSVDNLRIAVPEPATLGLLGLALAGFGVARRRRRA